MNSILTVLFFFLFMLDSKETSIFKTEAEQESWLHDWRGCNVDRSKLLDQVYLNCDGISKQNVLDELGEPNLTSLDSTMYKYFISSDCDKSMNIVHKRQVLVLVIKNDLLVSKGVDIICN